MATTWEAHTVDFPVPFPTGDDTIVVELAADEVNRLDLEQAIERGRHLVSSRYYCMECHGANFGGGVMVDAFPIGTLLGPNLTTGTGSRTLEYTAADWDRTVRHGILPDGGAQSCRRRTFASCPTRSCRISSHSSDRTLQSTTPCRRLMREGTRPDGTSLLPPMSVVIPYAQRMTDTELQAVWLYLRSLPPVASPP